jgi:hypothetical protein
MSLALDVLRQNFSQDELLGEVLGSDDDSIGMGWSAAEQGHKRRGNGKE